MSLPNSILFVTDCHLYKTAFSKYAQLQNTGTFSACDLGQECQNFNVEFPTADQAREIEFILFKRLVFSFFSFESISDYSTCFSATQSARTAGLPDSCSETCTSASCLCDTGNGFAAVQGKVGCSACVSTPATPMMINSYGYCVPQCTL